jgi:cob(I)alamin adenosyltransferase
MKIYTKRGDDGETALLGNVRVPKDDLRINAYGTLDELNACLGIILSESGLDFLLKAILTRIQNELFQVGAELATPKGKSAGIRLISAIETEQLEKEIDEMDMALPPLKAFILPGGSPISSHLHLARTVSRRAEREITTLHRVEPQRSELMRYINRLSDFLFIAARHANQVQGVADVPWVAPSN